MGDRGPKSKPNLKAVNKQKLRYPNPAPGMTKNARTTWHRIVRSFAHDHFKPHQYGMLQAYCEAESSHRKAILEIKKSGQVISTPNGGVKNNPWCQERNACWAAIVSLGTKLGLGANSTLAAKGIKGIAPQPKSKRGHLLNMGN